MRTCHSATLLGAAAALVGTPVAMLRLMLGTFGAAGVADFGAHATDVMCTLRSAAHVAGCRPTDLSAITIQPNAIGHHGDVVFAQARGGAVLALLGATDTGFDARTRFLVTHNGLPKTDS